MSLLFWPLVVAAASLVTTVAVAGLLWLADHRATRIRYSARAGLFQVIINLDRPDADEPTRQRM